LDINSDLFKDKQQNEMSLSTVFSDIYENQLDKSNEIKSTIKTMMVHVKDINDVTMLMPLIRDLIELGVKNDDQLVKLSTIMQRYIATKDKEVIGKTSLWDENEREELLQLLNESNVVDEEAKKLEEIGLRVKNLSLEEENGLRE